MVPTGQIGESFLGRGSFIFGSRPEPPPSGGHARNFAKVNGMERVAARRFIVGRGDHARDIAMSGHATDDEALQPATLFRVMQAAIAEGLRERYEPPRRLSHQMFVLTMQMNDRTRREHAQADQAWRGERQALRRQARQAARAGAYPLKPFSYFAPILHLSGIGRPRQASQGACSGVPQFFCWQSSSLSAKNFSGAPCGPKSTSYVATKRSGEGTARGRLLTNFQFVQ